MTTDKTRATVATAKHGGCVQLPTSERERFEAWASDCYHIQRMGDLYRSALTTNAWQAWQAALSAQPSPAGQGDALLREVSAQLESLDCGACIGSDAPMEDLHGRIAAHLAARQPVGEPVDDYESAFQEAEPPPLVVNAAGFRALESFLTVAEEFRRSTEPYIEAINEGGSAGDDEISEVFDRHLSYAKTAVSRSTVYAAPTAQAVDLVELREAIRKAWQKSAASGNIDLEFGKLLALIDSQAVGNK